MHNVKKISLKKALCQKFCSYYKKSKKEDLACMGFLVVEKLLRKGKEFSFQKSENKHNTLLKEKLKKTVCVECPFYEKDCDFVSISLLLPSVAGVMKPPPCGGFILLENLLENYLISIDDIKNII